jgi:D-serine deaminase-like pyridoxal phosphate-dependent protein
MSDLLIRDVPEEVLASIDARASRLGLSRTEYLRRRLAQEARDEPEISVQALRAFGETYGDLGDESVMAGAWS